MGLTFYCPHCRQKLNIALEAVDETTPCPLCKRRVGDPPEPRSAQINSPLPVVTSDEVSAANKKAATTFAIAVTILGLLGFLIIVGIAVLIVWLF
jgi:hypothetical protein